MQTSTYQNKLNNSVIENKMTELNDKSKVTFNVTMHGIKKDQTVVYGRASEELKRDIRCRIKDCDGSVSIENETKQTKPEGSQNTGKATKKEKGDK